MTNPKVSIVIPFKDDITPELIPALFSQTYKNYEVILVPDRKITIKNTFVFPKIGGPAVKRDYGVTKSSGSIITFIDSDAYPCCDDWLENIVKLFSKNVSAVCGPGLTPSSDSFSQQISGYVWSSWLGSGGAGRYRNRCESERYVDDYPSFNFSIRKNDFFKVGGFQTSYWPGEDTILCHEIVYTLHKKILYSPTIPVFHHRRAVLKPHLDQIGRYGLHRGYFTKILPKTSRRIGYFAPLFFCVYCIFIWLGLLFPWLYIPLLGYGLLLMYTALDTMKRSKNILISFLIVPTIFITHLSYGWMFLKGLLARNLES